MSIESRFNAFFSEESLESLKHPETMTDGVLLANLDDIVQVLAQEDNIQFAANDEVHRVYRAIKYEIMKRLK